ncbi:MAG: SIMPL domain-containing protein [Acidobacteria bacterium]|nr:SIMPL domain-containing protein [Acidobacteriota bacterium]
MLFCLSAIAFGQQSDTRPIEPTITVSGVATIDTEPDFAVISVRYEKTDKDLQLARKDVETGVASAVKIAKQYNIPARDVSTRNISVAMKFISIREANKRIFDDDDEEIGEKQFVGYEVSRTVTFKLTDLRNFDGLFNDILETKPSKIDDVSFDTSKRIELREEARTAAMKAAYDKAVSMTKAIGQKIGKAIKIVEGDFTERLSTNSFLRTNVVALTPTFSSTSGFGSFSAGTISVESKVTVVFALY